MQLVFNISNFPHSSWLKPGWFTEYKESGKEVIRCFRKFRIFDTTVWFWSQWWFTICMKNGKWCGILLYLWVTKLMCYSFIDAGEKHKIPRSETQNFSLFTATEVIRLMAFSFFWFTQGDTKRDDCYLHMQWVSLQEEIMRWVRSPNLYKGQ